VQSTLVGKGSLTYFQRIKIWGRTYREPWHGRGKHSLRKGRGGTGGEKNRAEFVRLKESLVPCVTKVDFRDKITVAVLVCRKRLRSQKRRIQGGVLRREKGFPGGGGKSVEI